jgi:hypothetical protein
MADQVAARSRRKVVRRSPEANSGGSGQGAETAGRREEGERAEAQRGKAEGVIRHREQSGHAEESFAISTWACGAAARKLILLANQVIQRFTAIAT